jgi:ArsR family transcriptional regulator
LNADAAQAGEEVVPGSAPEATRPPVAPSVDFRSEPIVGLIRDLGRLCRLLSDETRLRVLYLLTRQGEMHVRALCDTLEQSQPAVSHHLALLRGDGLIESRREGKHNFYRLRPGPFLTLFEQFMSGTPAEAQSLRFGELLLSRGPAAE